MSLEGESDIPTQTLNMFSTDGLNMSVLIFALYSIHLMLIRWTFVGLHFEL